MKNLSYLSFIGLLSYILACAPFTDSPFSDQLLHPLRVLNQISLSQLGDIENDGKIRFAVFTDSHQNYQDLDKVIYEINQTPDLDFVANLGDFTNSGYNLEYDQFLDACEVLHYPLLSAIGNHDAIGAGVDLFKKAFGDPNFWFESSSHRFIFFNSANLEDPAGFDPMWLKSTVDESSKPVFIFSHVQFRDADRFSGDVANTLDTIIANNKTQLILNGHNHIYRLWTDNNTVMLQGARVEKNQWLLVEIIGLQIRVQRMETGEVSWLTLKN